MTLNDLERQNKGFYGSFLAISGCDTSLSFTRWRYAVQVENLVFVY